MRMKVVDIPISLISKYFENGRIYFWGAGEKLEQYAKEFSKYDDISHVKAIVDSRQAGSRKIGSKEIPLLSVEQFLNEVTSQDLLIITTIYYEEIITYLREADANNKVQCSVYLFTLKSELDLERDSVEIPHSLKNTIEPIIPKVIHYCWFGGIEIPDQYKRWMETWEKHCPDYQIKRWDESNYDIRKNKFIQQAYEKKKWAFVSDYARLDIIYKYGGIYLDTDVELLKSLDDLLYNNSFCGFETKEYVNFGLGYGSVKGNPIIKEMINVYDGMSFINDDGSLNEKTCPTIQTAVLEKNGLIRDGSYQDINGVTVLPEIILCPLSVWTRNYSSEISKSYMIHHFAASWDDNAYSGVDVITRFYKEILDEKIKFK